MGNTNRKISPLGKVMLIYALVFALIAAAAIAVFFVFLRDYESSRPANAAADYIQSLSDFELEAALSDTLASLNHEIIPREDSFTFLSHLIRSADTVYSPLDSTGSSIVYMLKTDTSVCGRLTLNAVDSDFFGFSKYSAELSELDFSHFISEKTIVAPSAWTVYCGSTALGSNYIVDEMEYSILSEFYDDASLTLPRLCVYHTGSFILEPEISIVSPSGVNYPDFTEAQIWDNCTDAETAAVKAATENFLTAYIAFASNAKSMLSENYDKLDEQMVIGSSLQVRMRSALAGLVWVRNKHVSLKEINYNHIMSLGDGKYLSDFEYTDTAQTRDGEVDTTNRLKIIFTEKNGRLLAEAMTGY